MVERKLNFPEIGPTVAEMIPSKVLSSICLTESIPGKHVENLLISIKKSQAVFTGTSRSILPSRIIAHTLPRKSRRIICEKFQTNKATVHRAKPCSKPTKLTESFFTPPYLKRYAFPFSHAGPCVAHRNSPIKTRI